MMAVGWMLIAAACCLLRWRGFAVGATTPARAVYQLALHASFGDSLAVNRGDAFHAHRNHVGNGAPGLQFDFNAQLVAGHYRAAKFCPLNSRKHDEFVAAVFYLRQ